MLAIKMPWDKIIDYHPEECTKPECRCIEIAIANNNGNEIKNYPCLAKVKDIEKNKIK